jgi:hypothetical protein
MAPLDRPTHGQAAGCSLTAFILPSTRTQSLLHHVIVTDGQRAITQRPLPYGSPLPDGADAELHGLGYARLDVWQQQADGWRCAVEPLA